MSPAPRPALLLMALGLIIAGASVARAGDRSVSAVPVAGSTRDEPIAPAAIAAAADGKTLFLAAADSVLAVDAATNRIAWRTELPRTPSGLALSRDGDHLYVTCAGAQSRICELDPAQGTITVTYPAGHTTVSPVPSPDGKLLYVCNRFDDSVTAHDVNRHTEAFRVAVPRQPISLVVTADGTKLVVAHHLPDSRSDADHVAAEVSVVDVASRSVVRRIALPSGSSLVRDIKLAPDGRIAAVTHNLARFSMPTTQIDRGWINTSALTLIDVPGLAVINTVLLDNVDRGAANPWAIGWTEDGKRLAVTHAGTHELSVIEVPALLDKLRHLPATLDPARPADSYAGSRVVADVPNDLSFLVGLRTRVRLSGQGPRSLARCGSRFFVAHYFSDSLDRVDLAPGSPRAEPIALGHPAAMTAERRGEMLFNDATLSFQGWQSCASCHSNDGRVDGLNWDLLNDGIGNPKNTKSLLLAHRTPPAMSLGIRETAETAVRAGFRHILFTVPSEDVTAAVDGYLRSLQPVPSPCLEAGRLSPAAQRGEAIFRSTEARCASCHTGSLLTDLSTHDVGTSGRHDHPSALFDTPSLVELWRTAPYLHDGSCTSLQELWSTRNRDDRHGKTSHLGKPRIDDLVAYLLSL